MKNFFLSVSAKIFFIGFLILIFLIPISSIQNSIRERKWRNRDAKNEVAEKWGGAQKIFGPILIFPAEKKIFETTFENEKKITREKISFEKIFVLPENLQIDTKIFSEIRARGIFEVPLFRSESKISGKFLHENLKKFLEKNPNLKISEKPILSFGFSDATGIEKNPEIFLNDEKIELFSGSKNNFWDTGIHAEIDDFENLENFAIEIFLRGHEKFSAIPAGKNTILNLKSDFPTPSFSGKFLPKNHQISENGFSAEWEIPHFSRSFPQIFLNSAAENIFREIKNSDFGVELFLPVDFYQKNERAIKYAILFIFLTFGIFFVFEILQKLKIHPIQYLSVGAALCIFFLLFLALSEHVGFLLAYFSAAGATIFLISAYCAAILKNLKNAFFVAGFLFLLYFYLFFLLQMTDFAFIFGAIFLFLILSLFMFLTRKIDWYKISFSEKK